MRAVGIILAGGNSNKMRELTKKTCGGSYADSWKLQGD